MTLWEGWRCPNPQCRAYGTESGPPRGMPQCAKCGAFLDPPEDVPSSAEPAEGGV